MQKLSSDRPDLPSLTQGQIPKVAAVHDICGYGNCSLGVALPVLSAGGIEACAVPTSVLSAHTLFPSYTFFDTTPTLADFFLNWKELDVTMDGLYTGFLGSAEQIDLILTYCDYFPDSYRVIDPVMGDHGTPYPTYTEEMCNEMKRLVPMADILTPNLTEASILLDTPYPGQSISPEQGEAISKALLDMGAKHVVLKGIERDKTIYNAVMGQNLAYRESPHALHEVSLHGTGDLFASCLTAGIFSGHSLEDSVIFSANLVYRAIDLSTSQPDFQRRGVNYEPLMVDISRFCLNL